MSSENQTPVWLGKPSTGFISLDDDGAICPAVGAWLPHLLDAPDLLQLHGRDVDDNLPNYKIVNVEPSDVNASSVVTFRLDHPDFEDDSVTDPVLVATFSLTLPLSVVGVVTALSMVNEGFPIYLFASKKPRNVEDRFIQPVDAVAKVSMPQADTITHEGVIDCLSGTLSESFSTPLFPRSYFDVVVTESEERHEQNLRFLRAAQNELFNVMTAISDADENAIARLYALEKRFAESYELEQMHHEDKELPAPSDEAEADMPVLSIIHQLVMMLYQISMPPKIQEEDETPDIENVNMVDIELESTFAEIVNGELRELLFEHGRPPSPSIALDNYDSSDADQADPFRQGVPDSLNPLSDTLNSDENKELLELARMDWSRPEVLETMRAKYSLASIIRAAILVVSVRITIIKTDDVPPALNIARSLSSAQDSDMWEISAYSKRLEEYDVAPFSRLIGAQIMADVGPVSVYMPIVLHGLGHALADDDWLSSEVDRRLSMLDFKPPQLPAIQELLYGLLSRMEANERGELELDDEEYEDACAPSVAAQGIIESWEPTLLADTLALVFPILADLSAASDNLELGSEEWVAARKEYLTEVLGSISEATAETGRLF